MTVPLGFRPRAEQERLRLAEVLREAPPTVALGFDDDGWTAACLAIAGHTPIWASSGDPAPCAALLARLGLPPLGEGPADATLTADLSWVDRGVPGTRPSPRREGPLVTILTCTYNRAHLIRESLASALAQGWPCEVLVVDDGSTDGTKELLASIPGIRVLRQEPNQGKPAALARGVEAASGEAILVLDDDDVLLPDAVAVLATALFADPATIAVWADTILFATETGAVTGYVPACRVPAPVVRRAVLTTVPALPGATLVRTAAWRSVLPLDPSLIRGQDMDLFLALSAKGALRCVPLPTFRYRSHDGLRGSAAGQWRKQDQGTHRQRFLSCVRPVFRRRWTEASPIRDRDEGHAWALGLWQRDLFEEAKAELARWPGPWSEAEAWVRTQVGVPTRATVKGEVVVVVDDGDEGALELTLHQHAGRGPLFVDLEVPRDPLGNVRLFWPGTYGARQRLGAWVTARAPWHLALTSAPDWTIRVDAARDLPDLPAPEAAVALGAWRGVLPQRTRAGLPLGPMAARLVAARRHLDAGAPLLALGELEPVLSRLPTWRGAWAMTAEAFAASGHTAEAEACRARAG